MVNRRSIDPIENAAAGVAALLVLFMGYHMLQSDNDTLFCIGGFLSVIGTAGSVGALMYALGY